MPPSPTRRCSSKRILSASDGRLETNSGTERSQPSAPCRRAIVVWLTLPRLQVQIVLRVFGFDHRSQGQSERSPCESSSEAAACRPPTKPPADVISAPASHRCAAGAEITSGCGLVGGRHATGWFSLDGKTGPRIVPLNTQALAHSLTPVETAQALKRSFRPREIPLGHGQPHDFPFWDRARRDAGMRIRLPALSS